MPRMVRRLAALALLVSLLRAGPPPPAITVERALAWVEESGGAPLSAWFESDGAGKPLLKVAASARGNDEEAQGALFKVYAWDAAAPGGDPEEAIALDGPSLLLFGAQQTLLGLSRLALSHFAAPPAGGRVLAISPRRWLHEPRVHVTVGLPDGRTRLLRYHALTGEPLPAAVRVDFEDWSKDRAPAGFRFARTGPGRPGAWAVRERPDAASGRHVLVQEEDDPTDLRFPIALLEDLSMRDGEVSVKCRPLTGSVDQAVGLVFRYRDADNYYVTRANALEGNVRLYHVRNGVRVGFASHDGPAAANRWHDFRVTFRGRRIEVSWDGAVVISCEDGTFADEGAVGIWTKADSVSEFDDLIVTPAE